MSTCSYMLIDMYGAFLRRVRRSRQLTQVQLAEITGISQPNLSAYENDRRMPSLDVANRILAACGYELVAAAGPRQIAAPLPTNDWFPDANLPSRLPDDPPDEQPVVNSATPLAERLEVMHSVLALASMPTGR